MQTIEEIAREADCSHWTVRRYLKRGIIKGFRNNLGAWRFEDSVVQDIRRHMEQHGGPAGRPLIARP